MTVQSSFTRQFFFFHLEISCNYFEITFPCMQPAPLTEQSLRPRSRVACISIVALDARSQFNTTFGLHSQTTRFFGEHIASRVEISPYYERPTVSNNLAQISCFNVVLRLLYIIQSQTSSFNDNNVFESRSKDQRGRSAFSLCALREISL